MDKNPQRYHSALKEICEELITNGMLVLSQAVEELLNAAPPAPVYNLTIEGNDGGTHGTWQKMEQ